MENNPKANSPLANLYDSINKKGQNHYRNEWFKHFNLTKGAFYSRLKKPDTEDYALFQFIFGKPLLYEIIYSSYNFSDVERLEGWTIEYAANYD